MNIKYCKILNNVYKNENLLENLSALFKVQFRKDWIGRVYAVFNPHIQDGIFNPNNQIFEYTEQGLVNDAYVEAYILNQLKIAKQFIRANNLFDLLTYRLKKLDDNDNYLFIMEPITWSDCKRYTKRFIIVYSILLISIGFLIYFI
jgi:hypothetical protein